MSIKIKIPELENAQLNQTLYPDSFFAPTLFELQILTVFQYVQVCCSGERFWVLVIKIEDDKLTGSINNNLILSHIHCLFDKDLISFSKENIFKIAPNDNQNMN